MNSNVYVGAVLFHNIIYRFISVSDIYEPTDDGRQSGAYISNSYDASSHFESVCHNVKDLYRRIVGKELTIAQRSEVPHDK